jgi:uncharacterized protein DUF1552
MMVFKSAIPRRTFLRGVGTTLALPFLDAMTPAFGASTAAPARRLGVMYVPNGIILDKWTPAEEGIISKLSPTLEPLAPFRDQILVLSGLNQENANARPGEGGAFHSRACATFLTGVHPKPTEGNDMAAGISVDQIVAKDFGKATQLSSLELALDPPETAGACEPQYTCTYMNTLCWRSPTTPLPMENQPRAVFERLFGDNQTTDPAERLARIQQQRSLLDAMIAEVATFKKGLGSNDRAKLAQYLDAIRDVERRIQIAEQQSSRELPRLDRPDAIPASFEAYAKLMIDLQALAYQTDLTRVVSFMVAHERSVRTYSEIGVSDSHHPLSHHRGDSKSIEKLVQINAFHTKLLAYLLERLRSTPDGDGSLLDHTVLLYGSGISDGNLHTNENLPVLIAGGGLGVKGGRHLRYPAGTPMANLYLTILDKLGTPVDNLGDSTGKLDLLSVA